MAVAYCPTCRELLHEPGALRCRSCGADARGAPARVGMAVRLEELLSPADLAVLDAIDRLRTAAPGVAEWYRDARDDQRRTVEELLAELRRLRRPGG